MSRKLPSLSPKKTDDPDGSRVRFPESAHERVVRALLAHSDPAVRAAVERALEEVAVPFTEREIEAAVLRELLVRAAILRGGAWSHEEAAAESAVRAMEAIASSSRGELLRRGLERDREALRTLVLDALRLLARRDRGRPARGVDAGRAPAAVRTVLVALGLRSRGTSDDAVRKAIERFRSGGADVDPAGLWSDESDEVTVTEALEAYEYAGFDLATDDLIDLDVNFGRLHALLAFLNK
jgi:hypothetical protein